MGIAANASRSGDLLNDRYELSDLVETCETHQLYSARDTHDDRVVHIAMLRPEVALRAGVAQRFVQVPRQLTKLDHPNVVRVWSVESDVTGIPFVVEEPRAGRTLAAMIEAFPDGMPLGVAINLLVPIVEATAAAHGRGLVHGALDAEHVLLREQAGTTVPKIFGFSASDAASKASDDVHALGALFYRALSGQSAAGKRRAPLDEVAPHLPLELTELVERCLSSADERPHDARLLSDELSSLRQKLGGQRASAVSVERVVPKEPAPVAAPQPTAAAVAKARRRVPLERADTAPMSSPPAAPAQPSAIDAAAATCFDQAAPEVEPAAPATAEVAAAPASSQAAPLEQSSIDFPMASAPPAVRAASSKPPVPSKAQAEMPTEVDDPAVTREARVPGKAGGGAKAKAASEDIAVAGPARLAAAFSPLEGGPQIEQGETREAELGRAFRKAQEEELRAREARFGRMQALAAAASKEMSAGQAKVAPAAKPQAGSPQTYNKSVKRDQATPTAAEVIALGQLHAAREAARERRSAAFGGLLLVLFGVALARFVPLLTGDKAAVEEALGAHVKTAMAVYSGLAVVVLIKVWAMQIQTKAMLLKPVTYTLKVVVLCSVLLAAGYFVFDGSSMGIVGVAARRFLPWASVAFFLFLGVYGMTRGVRHMQANMIAGLIMTLAYGASFAGSYSITANVIAPSLKGASHHAMALKALANEDREQGKADLLKAASGALDPELAADIQDQATMEDGFKQVHVTGSGNSEAEAIEEITKARKRNNAKLENLSGQIKDLAK